MVYSYSQISQYLRCPRSYRYRYLDGWQEKETRAAMMFGRCFENALGAYFRKEDCGAALFKEWGAHRNTAFEYKKGETWDRLLHQGIHLLETFARQDRVRIHDPHKNLQIKKIRALGVGSEFVAYLDATGEVDGTPCLIDWKTTTSRYPEAPEGLFSLDPQLICYSWIPKQQLRELGWSKAIELVKVARKDREAFDCATWLHKAKELPKEGFKGEVERHLTGKETEPWEIIYFKLYKGQIAVVERALETAGLMLGTDKSRGYCLEMICADFLAGANIEEANTEALMLSLRRVYELLPSDQQSRFLHEITSTPCQD